MKNEIDIHSYHRSLQTMEKYVNKSSISDRNKQIIFEFRDFCSLDDPPSSQRRTGPLTVPVFS